MRCYLSLHQLEIEISCDRMAVIAAGSPTLVFAHVLGYLAMDAGEIVSRVSTLKRTH